MVQNIFTSLLRNNDKTNMRSSSSHEGSMIVVCYTVPRETCCLLCLLRPVESYAVGLYYESKLRRT